MPPIHQLKNDVIMEICKDLCDAISKETDRQNYKDLLKIQDSEEEKTQKEDSLCSLYDKDFPLGGKYLKIFETYLNDSNPISIPKKKKKKKKSKINIDDENPDEYLNVLCGGPPSEHKDITKLPSTNSSITSKPNETNVASKIEEIKDIANKEPIITPKSEAENSNSVIAITMDNSKCKEMITPSINPQAETQQIQTIEKQDIISFSEDKTAANIDNMKKVVTYNRKLKNKTHYIPKRNLSNGPPKDKKKASNFNSKQLDADRKEVTRMFMELNWLAPSSNDPFKGYVPVCIPKEILTTMNIELDFIISSIDSYNHKMFPIKMSIINKLEACIHFFFSSKHMQTHFCIYGSFRSNLCIESSDIDIGIVGLPITCSQDKIEEYKSLNAYLQMQAPFVKSVDTILSAKVPLIKIVVQEPDVINIKIDLIIADGSDSCPVYNGIKCVDLVNNIINTVQYSREATIVIKKLLSLMDLNIPYKGGLSSLSTLIMVAAFIKSTNYTNIAEIVSNFLKFYSTLDISRYSITSDLSIVSDNIAKSSLLIRHPLDSTCNISQNTFKMGAIQQYFKDLYQNIMSDTHFLRKLLQ